MNLLIVDAGALSALDELNLRGARDRQLTPMELADGRLALNADLLGDSGPGQTWERYGTFLASLPTIVAEASAFKAASAPANWPPPAT